MSVERVPIQTRELEQALTDAPDSVLRRAAQVTRTLLNGGTVIVEEFIGAVGDEDIIEETVLEAVQPS